MRTALLFFLCLVAARLADAQRIKYKDLFPLEAGMSNQELKYALREYIAADLNHPHANFRLALVYEQNYRIADPLTRFEYAVSNAEQARIRFNKAKLVIDEREVLRNNEYYAASFKSTDPKGKPFVDPEFVFQRMDEGIDSADRFLKRIPPIYYAFTQSVKFYDRAVKTFASINNEYMSLDDLYLYYNAETDHRLGELKKTYDSALFFFEAYTALTKDFPIPYHKQKYHIKPIHTYRLDGLITRMNFLTPDVELWDYAKWVDQVREAVTTEIVPLRSRLSQNEEKLDNSLSQINLSPTGDGLVAMRLDKQLVYNLNIFDKQSLVLALLEYKAFKQEWLLKSKTLHPDTISQERNAEIYSSWIYLNKTADTLLTTVKSREHRDEIRKHADFINKYYGGAEGLRKYVEDEQKFIETTFTQYSGELRAAVTALATAGVVAEKDKLIRFGKWNISLQPHVLTHELLDKGEPITLQHRNNADGSIYLAGMYKPDKKVNNVITFVARVNPDGKPGWIQNVNVKVDSLSATADANNFLGPLEVTQEGCAFVVHSVKLNTTGSRNTFVYLNEKGEDKFRIQLKDKEFPRELNFIEKSNSFVIMSKGLEEKPGFSNAEPVTITGVNALGDILWKRDFALAGTLTDLTNLMDGFLVVGNYSSLNVSGKEYKTKGAGSASPFLIKLNERGEIVQVNALQPAKSVYITDVVKVGDNAINLIGLESSFEAAQGKSLTAGSSVMHVMTNRLCQVIFSNY